MIKNILVMIALLSWSVLMFTGVMQSVEKEREMQGLDREFKEAVIKAVEGKGECK